LQFFLHILRHSTRVREQLKQVRKTLLSLGNRPLGVIQVMHANGCVGNVGQGQTKVQVQLNEINPCLVGLCPDCHVVVEWLAHGQIVDEPLWI